MKRKSLMNVSVIAGLLMFFSLVGIQTGEAVEEHHEPGAVEKGPASSDSPSSGMLPGPGAGGSSRMKGMMGEPDDEGGQGMMGMMDQGMMRMMMSHMMGGPGGMGKMMGRMAPGMMGREAAPGGMARLSRMLQDLNLTSEQWDQVRTLARDRLDKMVDLWGERMKLRIDLASLRWEAEMNPQHVKEVFVKEAEAEAEMFLAGFEYLRGLKAILTQEQLDKLEAQGF